MRRPLHPFLALMAVLLGAGCENWQPTQPRVPDPAFAISDGAHGGNEHFYWLPPMVAGAAHGGTFIETLDPVVRICDWLDSNECGATLLEFGRTHGPAAHRVGVDAHGQHYHLNWDVSAFPDVAPSTPHRVSVFLGDVELGFADIQLEAGGQALRNLKTQEIVGLVGGRTFPIKFRIEAELLPLALAFHTWRDGNYEVYLGDRTGQRLVNITNAPGLDGTPSWSPDGERIAFMSDRHDPGGVPDVYVMNADGSGVQRLTTGGGWKPAWSPDGTLIAFQRGWPPADTNQDIWTYDLAGGGETQLTDADCPPGEDHWEDIDPTWDPTGLPTFSRQENETPPCGTGSNFPITSFDVVVRVPWDPGVLRNLTRNGTVDQMSPAWSRDGNWLVFAQRTGDQASDLWVRPRFGGASWPLTTPPGWINQEADWSYVRSEIVFTRGTTEETLGLWRMTLDESANPGSVAEVIPMASWGRYRPPGN